MDALLETLNTKLREWNPETAEEVRERVREIISLADQEALDLLRSRAVEQEVLAGLLRKGTITGGASWRSSRTRP